MSWRILVTGKDSPYMNMAIDETIYRHVAAGKSRPTLRFYDWEPSSFSYGYNQGLAKELDLQKVKKSPFGFVRRPTGGRMVLHDNEVTYAVIAPTNFEWSSSLNNAYFNIAKSLQNGFEYLGIELELSENILNRNHQKEAINPCFSSSSQHELNYRKKKIVGSAQVRNNSAFLQHGSILKSNNQEVVADFLPGLNEEERLRIRTYLNKRTSTIDQIRGGLTDKAEIIECMIEGFRKHFNRDQFDLETSLSQEEAEEAKYLAETKYSQPSWNDKVRDNKKVLTH